MSDKTYVLISNTILTISVFMFIAFFDSFWFCLMFLFWKYIDDEDK